MTITDLSRVITPYDMTLDCVYSIVRVALTQPISFAFRNSAVEGYVDNKIPSDP